MRSFRFVWVLGVVLHAGFVWGQEGARWSTPRNILPPGMEAREANLVILADGSLNVTFRGAPMDSPEVGGIYFTRSTDQGYSWSKPIPAVSVPGIHDVTHQVLSESGNLLLYATVFRPPSFEILQFLSSDRGRTWRETDTVFAETDPIRSVLAWKRQGKMFLVVLTERVRPGQESEYSIWLVRGRASGAYWDRPVKIENIFATSITGFRLVESSPRTHPSIYWRQNGFEDHILEPVSQDASTWRNRPISSPPAGEGDVQYDMGIYYKVETTPNRQILFNRTDDEPPKTELITPVPQILNKASLKIVWKGRDNYSLPGSLRFEIELDDKAVATIADATQYEFKSLLNGPHRISLTAVDEAGNKQVPPTVERFTVKVLPIPQFTNPRNGDLLNKGTVLASWKGVHNCGPGAPLTYSLKVDDRDWTEFTAETSMEVTGLEDGEHAFFLRVKDALDNLSEDGVSVRFEVDGTPPWCTAEELPRNWEKLDLPWPGLPDYTVEFKVVGKDNRTPAEDLEYRYILDKEPPSDWRPISEPVVVSDLSDGIHTIAFQARDEAQNIQPEPTEVKFDFNTPPNTRVWLDETREPTTYRFAGKDTNSSAKDLMFRWRIDEGPWSEWTKETEVAASEIRKGISHGEHSLQVQARDAAGNVDPSPMELIIEVDTVPPPVPTGLVAISRDDGAIVELTWAEAAEPNVRYNVYRTREEKFDREKADLIVAGVQRTRCSDRPKREDSTVVYYYRVTALDRADNESEPSEPQSVTVLGNTELRVKEFKALASQIDDLIRAERWSQISSLTRDLPEPPPGWETFPPYWEAVARTGVALAGEQPDLPRLVACRTELENILTRYPNFPKREEAQRFFDEVKSRILWIQLKTYGFYAVILFVVLVFLFVVYRWIQNRRVTEMPKITVSEEGPLDITPSKEALKDPTVLRRWAEVQADSSSAENWSRLAFAFHNIGEVETAIQSLYKALEIDANNTRFHFQMGHFQREAGNIREAVRHFERYLQLNPESKKSAEEVRELLKKLKEQLVEKK